MLCPSNVYMNISCKCVLLIEILSFSFALSNRLNQNEFFSSNRVCITCEVNVKIMQNCVATRTQVHHTILLFNVWLTIVVLYVNQCIKRSINSNDRPAKIQLLQFCRNLLKSASNFMQIITARKCAVYCIGALNDWCGVDLNTNLNCSVINIICVWSGLFHISYCIDMN